MNEIAEALNDGAMESNVRNFTIDVKRASFNL